MPWERSATRPSTSASRRRLQLERAHGTSGFRFASRALRSLPQEDPFEIGGNATGVAFVFNRSDAEFGTIQWQTKYDNNDWFDEDDIQITDQANRYDTMLNNPVTSARRFQVRIIGLSANIRIREIQANVKDYSQEVTFGA